jgi:TPR repeat protein
MAPLSQFIATAPAGVLAGLLSYGPIEATANADDDTPESFDALNAEAAQGNVAAQSNLGFMYANGEASRTTTCKP